MTSREEYVEAAVAALGADLEYISGAEWSCTAKPGPKLALQHLGQVVHEQPVEPDFDPSNWPLIALESRRNDSTEEDDAGEAVANALELALEEGGGPWFYCPSHSDRALLVCCGVWTCPAGHDVSSIGALRLGQA